MLTITHFDTTPPQIIGTQVIDMAIEYFTELSEFESNALAASTVIELADAISEARPLLDRAFERPGNQESE
ncbi:MAG: hypothetical protein H5U32_03325 [Pseudomonas balearica]|uniref:hypothetical protein n=1 Tax=Stutzerimonas balearica TaxID=74829 RepID=UPI00198B86C0|nr:hypothetical protein [Stutzerimonas balearica]MBC7198260.1 hypothetical protein [Stutzerimonas balearica]